MENNYWTNFWKNYTSDLEGKDEQSQVLRTYNKKPISEEQWTYTVKNINHLFAVNRGDKVLDLCTGNGLLSKNFIMQGASVVAVDISEDLLKNINGLDGIETICSDIRLLNFQDNTFDSIILYAGIQYLNYKEAVEIIQNIYKWLKPGGCFFIGDIPDYNRRWSFFNTEERQKVYFDNLLTNNEIIGTWFEREWFDNLIKYIGFSKGEFILQDEKLIYSEFRFDYRYKK